MIGLIVLVLIIWGLVALFSKDEYVGFYYPNAHDLTFDIESSSVFDSLEMCRDWVDAQIGIYNSDGSSYDYECGKNCDLSGNKPYVCEETLK